MKTLTLLLLVLVCSCANLAPPRARTTPYIQDLHGPQEREPSPYQQGDALLCVCPPGTRLW